ncbi:MAG: DUF4115 domain-containing protein [Acidobacteria bacterium]|nr:DUF4115 domain-containing protein [Acidobacteriota bacterium]
MDSVGETLRRERLRQNLDLHQVARETKIGVRMLEAIEADDFEKLPGGVFAKSFVRQYARLLGLEEDELAAGVQRAIEPPSFETTGTAAPAPERDIPMPRVMEWEAGPRYSRHSALPALAMVVVVMLVCSAIYAWWQRSKQPATPAEVAATSAPAVPAPQPPPPQTEPAASVQQPQAQQAPPAEPAKPESQPPAQVEPAPAEAAVSGDVNVVLTAEEDTWVSARSEGKLLYTGTLKPNESKNLTGNGEVRVVFGNAGGVTIKLNGKPVPPVGPKGQVRVVQFSPGGVQIVPPKPSSPAPDAL